MENFPYPNRPMMKQGRSQYPDRSQQSDHSRNTYPSPSHTPSIRGVVIRFFAFYSPMHPPTQQANGKKHNPEKSKEIIRNRHQGQNDNLQSEENFPNPGFLSGSALVPKNYSRSYQQIQPQQQCACLITVHLTPPAFFAF